MSTARIGEIGQLNGEDIDRRVIEPHEFNADREAFVDVRIERSKGKASYSFIGPGVSQNAEQKINLTIPHGFNVGAASMPHGVVNNQHLHFTAEVFICTHGSFRVYIGENSEQSIDIAAGDIFSAPTWVFRGFENTGPDDGWMFAVLGGDDTGGILWAPHVLEQAAATGLYLAPDYAVLDAAAGDDVAGAIQPLSADDLVEVDSWTDEELSGRLVSLDLVDWSDRGLLSAVVGGHEVQLAPVIGHGLSEQRRAVSPITDPHGFSIEWMRIQPGSSTGEFQIADPQVLLLVEGDIEVAFGSGDLAQRRTPATGSVVSVPENLWRTFTNVGDEPALLAVVCGADAPSSITWSDAVVNAAMDAGFSRDRNGCVAPAKLVGGQQ